MTLTVTVSVTVINRNHETVTTESYNPDCGFYILNEANLLNFSHCETVPSIKDNNFNECEGTMRGYND